jgi:outer membrane protein assembly factor BamB
MRKAHVRTRTIRLLLSAWAAAAFAPAGRAQDWPQWRGPARDGKTAKLALPQSWTASTLKPGWKLAVGAGHASPVVVGDRVLVFAREADDEVLSSLELATGKRVWRQSYPAPYTINPAATGHGKGPKATPVVKDGRVCTLGISGILSCHDAASGRTLWRHDFKGGFKHTSPEYGTAQSPVIEGGLLIVHVGGDGDGALTAFDVASGSTRWSFKGDGPGYASPLVVDLGGVRQVVNQTQKLIVGVDAASGALLWKLPFITAYEQNAVTLVVDGDVVIYSGLDKGVHAARVSKRGGAFGAEPLWRNDEVSFYMSTPVLARGVLYGLSHKKKGQFCALDAATGRTLWLGEGRQGENAALVDAGTLLFLLTTEGALHLARTDPAKFGPLTTYTVADTPTWAHPVVTSRGVLVKDLEHLAFWRFE